MKEIHSLRGWTNDFIGRVDSYTNNWGKHFIIFGSTFLISSISAHKIFRVPYDRRWVVRRTIAAWCTFGTIISYCHFEGSNFRRQGTTDPQLKRIMELRERAVTREWQKVPISLQMDHLLPLVGDEDIPLGISERIGLFTSRIWSSDATRAKFTALLRPEVEAGRLSTQDYDLCITALANKADMFAFLSHCAVSLGTIMTFSLLLLCFARTRPIALRLPWARMIGPTVVAISTETYHDARLPSEFRDKPSVIGVMERLFSSDGEPRLGSTTR